MKNGKSMMVIGFDGAPSRGDGGMEMPRSGSVREVSVPMSLLSVNDGETEVPPEKGDTVDFQVTGKILVVEGKTARVLVEQVNGQPVPDAEENPEPDEADDEARLRKAAMDEDEQGMGGGMMG